MSDIRLELSDEDFLGDFVISANDIDIDDGLETSVVISLFTDARAQDGTEIIDGTDDPRGFWGDTFNDDVDDQTGSLLWTLEREKQTTLVLRRAEQYCRDALVWMIEDRVASQITVVAEIVDDGILGLNIQIQRPSDDAIKYRYDYAWRQQAFRRVN